MTRFAELNTAELQQLLCAVIHGEVEGILGDGPGNLLPALNTEISTELNTQLAREKSNVPD